MRSPSVSSAHDKFLAPWARQVEAQSGGRIRIDLFPSMQLGGAPADLFDQARDGVVDIAWAQPSNTPGRFPKIEAFELPFVPSRRALVSSKAVEDYARANLADEFREVHPICFSCSDRGVLHANRPVRTIEEMRDLRLHVQTRFAVEAVHWLGAVAVPMPSAQLPLAITQHVIDGCIDPWDMVPTFKLNDLLKTHTEFSDSSLSTTTFVLAMNKAAYDKLPRDLKTVIDNNSGQPAATIAGAMWDVQAAAVVDMVGEPRRSDHHAVAGSRRALAQSHRAGDRGLAERHEGAQGRRRQAPRQRARAAGEIRQRARTATARSRRGSRSTRGSQSRRDHAAESRGDLVNADAFDADAAKARGQADGVRHHAGNPADARADGGRAIAGSSGQAGGADRAASPGDSLGDAGADSCSGRAARCGSGSAAASSAGRKSAASGATDAACRGGTRAGAPAAAEDSRYSACRRISLVARGLLRQRMAGHQVVGMFPAGQRLDAIEPGGDVLVRRRQCRSRTPRADNKGRRPATGRRWSAPRRECKGGRRAACRRCRACCRCGL